MEWASVIVIFLIPVASDPEFDLAQALARPDLSEHEFAVRHVGAKARWAAFGSLSKEATFNLVRSHIPVQANGVDPFISTFEFDGLAYYAVTVNLKCRL